MIGGRSDVFTEPGFVISYDSSGEIQRRLTPEPTNRHNLGQWRRDDRQRTAKWPIPVSHEAEAINAQYSPYR